MELRCDEVRGGDECGTEATNERHQPPSLRVDLLVEITTSGDGIQARLDPCKPIARFKIGRFKGYDSGFHAPMIAAAASVVKRWGMWPEVGTSQSAANIRDRHHVGRESAASR